MSLERNRGECLPCTSCLRSHYKQNSKAIAEWWCNSSVKMAICSVTLCPNRHKEEKAALGKWRGFNRNLYCVSKWTWHVRSYNTVKPVTHWFALIKTSSLVIPVHTTFSNDSQYGVSGRQSLSN